MVLKLNDSGFKICLHFSAMWLLASYLALLAISYSYNNSAYLREMLGESNEMAHKEFSAMLDTGQTFHKCLLCAQVLSILTYIHLFREMKDSRMGICGRPNNGPPKMSTF